MKYNLLFCAITAIILSSCNNSEKKAGNSGQDSASVKASVDIKDGEKASVYQNYIALKDALVKSDSSVAKSAGSKLAAALKAVEGCETTSKIADSISSAGSISAQRKHFVLLSTELIPLMKHTPIASGNIFVQFCPMANEGKGAFWLASEKEIKNPYYGDEMLECGEVKEEIKAQ